MPRVGSDKWLVVDRILCDPEVDTNLTTKDIRELARKLSSADPSTFGILQCQGVVRVNEPNTGRPTAFDFIFQVPRELSNEPRGLRSYLSLHFNHTLTDRFHIAKQLAKSISYVHTLGFVHKNVRPETIIGFQTNDSKSDLFFLVGFEKVRTVDGRTRRSRDSVWEKNLYRHPHRQGLDPEENYIMQHDIYSLGVCLLEIGLWKSFVSYLDDAEAPVPAAILGITLDNAKFKQPVVIKEHLIALARRSLPQLMGSCTRKSW